MVVGSAKQPAQQIWPNTVLLGLISFAGTLVTLRFMVVTSAQGYQQPSGRTSVKLHHPSSLDYRGLHGPPFTKLTKVGGATVPPAPSVPSPLLYKA